MLNLKEFKTMNKQVNDYYYLFNTVEEVKIYIERYIH